MAAQSWPSAFCMAILSWRAKMRNTGTELKMKGLCQFLSQSGRRMAVAVTVLAAGLLVPDLVAMGQDQSAATAEGVILARKTLMNSIGDNSDRIANMISERNINLHDAHVYANNISVMLTAFPHLFPPNSNQWTEGADLDPATDTVASPEIWTNFADFYQLALAAAKRADEMKRADNEDDVKSLHRALGNICDFCHALYFKE